MCHVAPTATGRRGFLGILAGLAALASALPARGALERTGALPAAPSVARYTQLRKVYTVRLMDGDQLVKTIIGGGMPGREHVMAVNLGRNRNVRLGAHEPGRQAIEHVRFQLARVDGTTLDYQYVDGPAFWRDLYSRITIRMRVLTVVVVALFFFMIGRVTGYREGSCDAAEAELRAKLSWCGE